MLDHLKALSIFLTFVFSVIGILFGIINLAKTYPQIVITIAFTPIIAFIIGVLFLLYQIILEVIRQK